MARTATARPAREFGVTLTAIVNTVTGAPTTSPERCPACAVVLTDQNRLRVHAGDFSCGHGPHD